MKRGRMQAKDVDDREFLWAVHCVQIRSQQRLIRKFRREGRADLAKFYTEHLPNATWGSFNGGDAYDSERAIKFRRDYGPFIGDYFLTVPWKVLLAKARRLVARGLLDGCACGCRGDFEITEKGIAFLAVPVAA